jgi:hypothetical protein
VGKGILKIIVRQRKGTFSAKKCCINVQKVMPKRNADGRVLEAKIMPIIYIKGSFMKHPVWPCAK